ncbi:methylenetetrahydrofolate dehydrogenase (NADP+)/methenyltetrahydrofolate cyclohydrolase [Rhodoligotrophos appendicifer]|uniref:bifunctional 5,10-methylenetetrahydrofolate dehydrogenase/5,10-methenyltetrahydrofolate cyclohydrolase n=1 Tax=Rhodoligotrophos appendicifer TaxID=987056 RepID=UPI001185A102|nr:bifunctional 5,10-methylenetetrahydrofolate dehydrogenase/5,10-methenyltetrahydrofolate cyclohydrolase [Rhodoligotrophos appendicifer]
MTDFSHKLLDGRKIAAGMHDAIANDAQALKEVGWPVRLVSIAVGESEPAALYIRNQARVAEKLGIAFEDRFYPETTGADELTGIIQGLNLDPRVSGVIIQRPLPAHIQVRTMQRAVHPFKDVEGMHPSSIGDIVYNDLVMGPCTAVAAVEILKTTALQLEGLEVVVIGHSDIVGKPIAFLLMGAGATVSVCHALTRNLAVHSRAADAVFVAVGKPGLLTGNMLKPGAAVIDIGINQVTAPDGSVKVAGDADFDSCAEVAGWITPVPGGVGPVTVATLMRNAVKAASLQRSAYERHFGATEMVR